MSTLAVTNRASLAIAWFSATVLFATGISTRADRDTAIARATASVEQAAARAAADPTRPIYHFHPPAQWMNDPNGPIYYRGLYHVFYQFNPFGDVWGNMHWGHARSRDLVHWQHLPVALWPSGELGEEHVFSGCTTITGRGQPMILYTSIAKGKPAETHAEQWAALGDKDLVRWQKHPGNPILTEALHGERKVFDWRDPFFFRHEGVGYLVIGGNLNQRQGGQAVVNLYRAEDGQLNRWKYVGILFTHPDPTVTNIECPNFFKLDNRWVLVVSPHRAPEYFVGEFDAKAGRFTPRTSGVLDPGNEYAPNSCLDGHGRRILWGWVNGFKSGRGWNGCLTIPRVLSLEAGSILVQKPASELKRLRADHFRVSDVPIEEILHEVTGASGDCLEIYAQLELMKATSVQLQVRRSADGVRSIPITVTRADLEVAGTKASFSGSNVKVLTLRVFLDKSVLEVFGHDRACITRVIDCPPGDVGIAIVATGGTARLRSFHTWKMRP